MGDTSLISMDPNRLQYEPGIAGNLVYGRMKTAIGADVASNELKANGIHGIRYLDAGSRAAGDGSRNYVVFDDSLIDIIRKYGIAGLMMGGMMQPNQAQAGQ